jgi:hypothetical protein
MAGTAAAGTINAKVSDDTPYVDEAITVTLSGQNEGIFPDVNLWVGAKRRCDQSTGNRWLITSQRVSDGAFSVSTTVSFPKAGTYVLCYELAEEGKVRGSVTVVATESVDCVDARDRLHTAKLLERKRQREYDNARTRAQKRRALKRLKEAQKAVRAAHHEVERLC